MYEGNRRAQVQIASANVNEYNITQNAYESALKSENVVLSHPGTKTLTFQIVKMMLDDVLKKLDGPSKLFAKRS